MKYPIIHYSAYSLCQYGRINRAKGIRGFDCITISLEKLENCGEFITWLPISPADYRKEHPTEAKVEIIKKRGFTKFKITDDWGDIHVVKISNRFWHKIKQATQSAIEQNLIRKPVKK